MIKGVPTLFHTSLPARQPAQIKEGLVFLPEALGISVQAQLVHEAREYARSLQGTPFAMQRPHTRSGQMKVYMFQLGRHWGYEYGRYTSEVEGQSVPPVPKHWVTLAQGLLAKAAALDEALAAWVGHYRIEAALVNFYPEGASMGMHQDAFEHSNAPVVSLSIGDEAIFRAGNNETRTKPYEDLRLMSGDVVIFGGPSRAMFHGVPKLFPDTAPSDCGLQSGRINITFRQVEV